MHCWSSRWSGCSGQGRFIPGRDKNELSGTTVTMDWMSFLINVFLTRQSFRSIISSQVAEKLPSIVFNQCFLERRKVHEAHVTAFEEVEAELAKTSSTAGCCANSCVCWSRFLWCSNLGDCRALYIPLNAFDSPSFETGTFCWLSRDLKATTSYEQDRILSCGWRVLDGRVEGLEPTRTIGDFDVKAKVG